MRRVAEERSREGITSASRKKSLITKRSGERTGRLEYAFDKCLKGGESSSKGCEHKSNQPRRRLQQSSTRAAKIAKLGGEESSQLGMVGR